MCCPQFSSCLKGILKERLCPISAIGTRSDQLEQGRNFMQAMQTYQTSGRTGLPSHPFYILLHHCSPWFMQAGPAEVYSGVAQKALYMMKEQIIKGDPPTLCFHDSCRLMPSLSGKSYFVWHDRRWRAGGLWACVYSVAFVNQRIPVPRSCKWTKRKRRSAKMQATQKAQSCPKATTTRKGGFMMGIFATVFP